MEQKCYEKQLQEMTYRRLCNSDILQDEAIARHYASMIRISHDLLKLLEIRRYATKEQADDLDELIAYASKTIRDKHREDFGIELNWKVR